MGRYAAPGLLDAYPHGEPPPPWTSPKPTPPRHLETDPTAQPVRRAESPWFARLTRRNTTRA